MAKKKNDDIEVIKDENGDIIIIDDDDDGGSTGRGCLFGGLITIVIGIIAIIAGGVYLYIKQDVVLDYLGLVKTEDISGEIKREERVIEEEFVDEKATFDEEFIEEITGEEEGEGEIITKPVIEPELLLTDDYLMGLGTTLKPAKQEVLRDRVNFIISSTDVLSPQHKQMVLGKMMYALSDDWIDSDEWKELMGLIYDYM